jgi:nitrile hydratase subunit beta
MPLLTADMVPMLVKTGASARVNENVTGRFKVGDQIVVRNINPAGHTRLPRYVRGKRGTVQADWGVFIFPDTHAHGKGPQPQHVYSVKFASRELWGPSAPQRDVLYIDVWDDYMDLA